MKEKYIEINIDNLKHNVNTILNKYNDYDYYIGVLKGDAYGHGEYIVNELLNDGINYFAVATIKEALDIRKYNKDVPILLLEPISLEKIDLCINNNLTLTLHNIDYVKKLISILNNNIKIHIKIDSGMGRLGFNDKFALKETIDILKNNKFINIEGIYSHFATIGVFDKKWDNQIHNFKDITSLIDINSIPIRHMGSSITLLTHPKIDFTNGIRIGTIMYGYNITYRLDNNGLKNRLRYIRNIIKQKKLNISQTYINVDLDLLPCMKFYTSILDIKKINKSESIGYGANVILKKDTYIGIIPIGYNNGIGTNNIDRFVIINNKKYKVLSIGMNMSFIELDNDININDKVIILDNKNITIGMLGRFTNRTFHEMLLNIGKNNERRYIKNNNIEYIEE